MKNRPAGILLEPVNSGLFSINYELYQQINEEAPCLLLHSGNIGACHALSLHDRIGAQLLTEHLLSLGHTKIGVILCIEEYTGQKRYCGFLSTLRSQGLTHNQGLLKKRENLQGKRNIERFGNKIARECGKKFKYVIS